MNNATVLGLIFSLIGQQSLAAPCLQWKNAERIGTLDEKITEASGMEISKQFPNRVYHINDSGSKGEFFVTDLSGKLQDRVKIKNFNPIDTEDMSLGPCGADTCLFIADTGDNKPLLSTATIIAINEKKSFNGSAEISTEFKIKYPDLISHNIESIAIHPNGSLFVITKDYNKKEDRAEVAQVFWLPTAELWENPGLTKTLRPFGQLDVARILGNPKGEDALITSMAISPKGDRFAVLTYLTMIEFNFDISEGIKNDLSKAEYTIVPTEKLRQQESIAYSPVQDALIYTTEDDDAPMYQALCSQR